MNEWTNEWKRSIKCQEELLSIAVLVGFCQLDTNIDLSEKGESQLRHCRHQIGLWAMTHEEWPSHCGQCLPRADSRETSKREAKACGRNSWELTFCSTNKRQREHTGNGVRPQRMPQWHTRTHTLSFPNWSTNWGARIQIYKPLENILTQTTIRSEAASSMRLA